MAPARKPASTLDRLISESKQITSDLMALRHEIERVGLQRRQFGGGPGDRAYLICDNLRRLTDDVHKIWHAATHLEDEDEWPIFDNPRPRALTNGRLRLTAGGD